jgi:hypothetical protein
MERARKSAPGKMAIAARWRRETTMPINWIAARIHLGTSQRANARVHQWMRNNPITGMLAGNDNHHPHQPLSHYRLPDFHRAVRPCFQPAANESQCFPVSLRPSHPRTGSAKVRPVKTVDFRRCQARTPWHSVRHDLRTVARRMEGVARPRSVGALPAQRAAVCPIPGDGRQP